ncbi:fungal specific transcription factor domain-containing protein [Aspergillus novofumigatus IBT 16806]|uniref:Xylanolytic transcriptional activator regulatory domain-containing protein n=1 Tax=Aspergillus novofumigatus (strain IBT 16806) TaxID=1392255 RepID=A0A2I1BSK3_ASPN1|nr:uncharacterized protein P174DRAFT_380545 [Aspergillus novofumigatus IBT 16806]PKX88387.1 hypothetical protein P174DRAFT_380545 [Aspergillus novofumigatus IBT 16806]
MPPFATILRTIQGKGQWWEQWRQKTFGSAEPTESFSQFADRVYRSGHPSEVGQLAIAYGMAADTSNLFRYLDSVERWVISNDEYASSPEGIECMLLQGKCLADIGQPQRCWSAWRRALLYAELRGLHRNHSASDYGDRIWWSLFIGDRFASLFLGVPYGISDRFCDISVRGEPSSSYYALQQLQAKVGLIIGRVIDHIHSGTTELAHNATSLDHELEEVASSMPPSWWDLPAALLYTDKDLMDVRLRLSLQLCFHHVKTYLHLPLMLRYPSNAHCSYNTEVCLKSAREVLRRFLFLRKKRLGAVLDECRTTDFIGFTAAIILILGLFGYNWNSRHRQGQDSEDFQILKESLHVFKDNSTAKEERLAARCFESLEVILGAIGPESVPWMNCGCVLKLTVPYFGTISIVRRSLQSDTRDNIQSAVCMPCEDPSTRNHQLGHCQESGPGGPGAVFSSDNPGSALPCEEEAFVEYSGLYSTNYGANGTSECGPLAGGHPSTTWQDTDKDWVWWESIFGNDRNSPQQM